MTKSMKLRGLTAAALAATALFAAQPAAADTIEINNFWAGYGVDSISFSGINWKTGKSATVSETAYAGGFKTYDLSTDPTRKNAFQSFCVDIFDTFSFGAQSKDTLKPATIISTRAAVDLGRLYTNHHAAIDSKNSSGNSEAAFQLAVWEIVNEKGAGAYSLSSGDFKATGNDASLAQKWLKELGLASASAYDANIWSVQSMISTGKGISQDLVVFSRVQTPVPEPETYAMMLVGLGLLGFSARRKNRN
jgi:hypothetical protein